MAILRSAGIRDGRHSLGDRLRGADPSNEQPEQKGIGRIVIVDGRIMFGSCLELDESVHGGPYGPCDEVRVIPPDLSRGLPVAHQLGHGGEACFRSLARMPSPQQGVDAGRRLGVPAVYDSRIVESLQGILGGDAQELLP